MCLETIDSCSIRLENRTLYTLYSCRMPRSNLLEWAQDGGRRKDECEEEQSQNDGQEKAGTQTVDGGWVVSGTTTTYYGANESERNVLL